MVAYKYVQEYLKKFIDDNICLDFVDIPDNRQIENFSKKNGVWSIVQYVNKTYNKDSIEDWGRNKNEHVERIKACNELFEILEGSSIPYAIIKGAYLDKIAYKNIGLRSSDDVDLLINKKDYRQLNELLYLNGFVCGEWNFKEQRIVEYSRDTILYNYLYTHQSAPYVKVIKGSRIIEVDINFSISWGEDVYGVTLTEQILNDSQIINYEGFNYRVLNPEMFLLQLCLHSYRDMNSIILLSEGSFKLRLLCDIYYYIYNVNKLNLDKFVKLCVQYHYEKYIYYILYYTTMVFGNILWIDSVMNLIKPNDLNYLNAFGLSDDEIKIWNIGFQERFTCENLYEKMKPLLLDADINKIESIKNNM